MTPEEFSRILDELTKRLGPAGRHLLDLAIRQVYIDSTIGIVIGSVMVIGSTIGLWLLARWWRQSEEMDDSRFASLFLGLAAIAFLGIGLWVVPTNIAHLANVEWAAIQKILYTITQ